MYYVYVLLSGKDCCLYTGIAADVDVRLRKHNAGGVRSTKSRRPLFLLYTEEFADRGEAFVRERYLKTAEGGALKQRLVAEARMRVVTEQKLDCGAPAC